MIFNHSLDNSQHECVLIYILGAIDLRLPELSRISYHEFQKVIKLRHIVCYGIFNEVLVDWNTLNDVDNPFDIELASECLC